MNPQLALLHKFEKAIPGVQSWIDETLAAHSALAVTVGSLGFSGLARCFPSEFLDRAKVIPVAQCPVPPLSKMGLAELSGFEQMNMAGITFRNSFFVLDSHRSSERLHFHELVHVAQWGRLGVVNFLRAYGLGLAQFGYEQSPLEQMAYAMQHEYERGNVTPGLVDVIHQRTDDIWKAVGLVLLQAGINTRASDSAP